MTEFILRVIAAGGYLGFAFLMALENVFPPIPSEFIMGFGGMAAAQDQFHLPLLVLVGTVGATLGNTVWYAIGRRVGHERLKPIVERHGRWLTIEWADVEWLREQFRRRGGRIIFTFRFLPAFRTIVSLPAGMAAMPVWRFLLFTFAGTAIWNSAWATAGYLLHERFRALEQYVGWAGLAAIAGSVLLYLYRITTWKPRHARG